ncbi:MAG: SO2930 family diheme c-type cytochrome [Pseudomonadales bacterium]
MFRSLTAAALLLALSGCGDGGAVRFFEPDAYPAQLSEWNLLHVEGDRLRLGDGVEAYDLNTPLFTDYAQKLRAIYLPPGTAAQYRDTDAFEFPVGTVLVKTFFYPKGDEPGQVRASYDWAPGQTALDRSRVEILETRLLVHQAHGWDALPYVWRGDDAVLTLAGSLSRLTLSHDDGRSEPLPYIVPTRNECAACHATDHTAGALEPIGPKARHLNRGYLEGPDNQLTTMAEAGRLLELPAIADVPANARLGGDGPVADQARAYLDVNCGHCHNPRGAADTSGLLLDAATTSTRAMGFCKPPIAAGQGTGGRTYSIVPGDPDDSIIVFRMATSDPGARMPEIGRSLVHAEGVKVVSDWIGSLTGECIEERAPQLTGG